MLRREGEGYSRGGSGGQTTIAPRGRNWGFGSNGTENRVSFGNGMDDLPPIKVNEIVLISTGGSAMNNNVDVIR
jgi:hypothetical protein